MTLKTIKNTPLSSSLHPQLSSITHTYPDKPIYVEINNKGTVTDDISTFLRERGFSITGRRLYEHHSRFAKEIKNKVLFYYTMLGIAVAPPPENDVMYYFIVVTLHDHLAERLNEAKSGSISCKYSISCK
jgi:hypothetical protein